MEQEKLFFMGRFKEMFSVARYREVDSKCRDMYSSRAFPWVDPLYSTIYKSTTNHYLGENFVDIEWEFLNGSVENPDIQKYLVDAAANEQAKLTIAVCLPENSRAIAAAAYLPDSVYESQSTIQVLVYQRLNNNLLSQINNNERYCKKLKAFGMASECYDSKLIEVSECMVKTIKAAYEQYGWKKMVKRCKEKGLIEDDYEYLSGDVYDSSSSSKNEIEKECNGWMNEYKDKPEYSNVKGKLNEFRKEMDGKFGSPTNKTQSPDKPKSAKMWSNQYNIYTMWTKFRCVGLDPIIQDFDPKALDKLGKVEHNRWIVEQLLLRYRPLTKEEQLNAQIKDLYSSSKQKNTYKKKFAHLDICSNARLADVDCNVAELDQELIGVIPKAYRNYLEKK